MAACQPGRAAGAAGTGSVAPRGAHSRDVRALPYLDVPVLQSVDQPVDVLKILDISSLVEQVIDGQHPASRSASCAAAGGTGGGRANALLPQVQHQEEEGDSGTVLGRSWPHVFPVLWATVDLLVGCGAHVTPSGTPQWDSRQPRAVHKYWARMTWCTAGRQVWTTL